MAIKNILINPVYLIADGEAYRYLTGHGAEVFGTPEDFDGVRGILARNRDRGYRCHSSETGLNARLKELEAEGAGQAPSQEEVTRLCQRLSSFSGTVEGMTVEEKRAALRRRVSKVVWDGTQARVLLAGREPLGQDSKCVYATRHTKAPPEIRRRFS